MNEAGELEVGMMSGMLFVAVHSVVPSASKAG
jgi:hypothetical protein